MIIIRSGRLAETRLLGLYLKIQGDTLAPYLFIIFVDYILRTSIDLIKENGFTLKKGKKQTIPHTNNADDIELLENIPTQPESLLHNQEQAAGGIGLHINADKMEYTCFNQKGDISTLNVGSLKIVDKFTYLGSSVSSAENDINM